MSTAAMAMNFFLNPVLSRIAVVRHSCGPEHLHFSANARITEEVMKIPTKIVAMIEMRPR